MSDLERGMATLAACCKSNDDLASLLGMATQLWNNIVFKRLDIADFNDRELLAMLQHGKDTPPGGE